jgi:hypothetical protein
MSLEKIQELAAIFNRMLASAPDAERRASVIPDYSGLAESADAAAEWNAETQAARMRAAQLHEELLEEQRVEQKGAARARTRDARLQVATLVLVAIGVLLTAVWLVVTLVR